MKKTAEEIYTEWFGSSFHTTKRSPSKGNIIKAMEEYASQRTAELEAELVALSDHNSTLIEERDDLKPNWIKGLPPEDFGICLLNTIDKGVVTGHTQTMKDNFELWKETVTHYSACLIIQPPKED